MPGFLLALLCLRHSSLLCRFLYQFPPDLCSCNFSFTTNMNFPFPTHSWPPAAAAILSPWALPWAVPSVGLPVLPVPPPRPRGVRLSQLFCQLRAIPLHPVILMPISSITATLVGSDFPASPALHTAMSADACNHAVGGGVRLRSGPSPVQPQSSAPELTPCPRATSATGSSSSAPSPLLVTRGQDRLCGPTRGPACCVPIQPGHRVKPSLN